MAGNTGLRLRLSSANNSQMFTNYSAGTTTVEIHGDPGTAGFWISIMPGDLLEFNYTTTPKETRVVQDATWSNVTNRWTVLLASGLMNTYGTAVSVRQVLLSGAAGPRAMLPAIYANGAIDGETFVAAASVSIVGMRQIGASVTLRVELTEDGTATAQASPPTAAFAANNTTVLLAFSFTAKGGVLIQPNLTLDSANGAHADWMPVHEVVLKEFGLFRASVPPASIPEFSGATVLARYGNRELLRRRHPPETWDATLADLFRAGLSSADALVVGGTVRLTETVLGIDKTVRLTKLAQGAEPTDTRVELDSVPRTVSLTETLRLD